MARNVVGSLRISLVATTGAFRASMRKASAQVATFRKNVTPAMNAARKFAPALAKVGISGTGAAAGLTALVAVSLTTIDTLAKTSDKLGIATERLVALQFAGERTGVATDTFNMAIQRMTRRVAEAAQGTGEAKGAIEELGLSTAYLASLSPDEQFILIADAMSRVASQGDRVRLAMRLFDSEGVALVNTLALGARGLDDMARQAERAGVTLSRIDAAQVEAANDAINVARRTVQGLVQDLAVDLAPVLKVAAEDAADLAAAFQGVGTADGGLGLIATTLGAIGDLVSFLQRRIDSLFESNFRWLGRTLDLVGILSKRIERIVNLIPFVEIDISGTLGRAADLAGDMADAYATVAESSRQTASFTERAAAAAAEIRAEAERRAAAAEASRFGPMNAPLLPGLMPPPEPGPAFGPEVPDGLERSLSKGVARGIEEAARTAPEDAPLFPGLMEPPDPSPFFGPDVPEGLRGPAAETGGAFRIVDSLKNLAPGRQFDQPDVRKPVTEATVKKLAAVVDRVLERVSQPLAVELEL